MAQGRSAKIISMIKWIRTSRLSIKNCLSVNSAEEKSVGSLTKGLADDQVSAPPLLKAISNLKHKLPAEVGLHFRDGGPTYQTLKNRIRKFKM